MEHRGRTIQRFEMGLPAVLYEKGVGRHIIRTDETQQKRISISSCVEGELQIADSVGSIVE